VPTKVLLTETSWWPCASRLAMGFAKMGYSVSAIYPASGHPLSKTSVIQQRFSYSPVDPIRSLRAAIEALDPDIVVPCDDRAVGHLHELHVREIAQFPSGSIVTRVIEESLGLPTSYPVVSSRYDLLEIAREEGIRIPETRLVRDASELRSGHTGLEPPWVLKADSSWGGHGVRMAHDPEQAEKFFLELSSPLATTRFIKRLMVNHDPYWLQTWLHRTRPAVIVQSHIQGRPANSAVACWKGKVLAGIAVEVVNSQGATGSAVVVRVVDRPEMLVAAERLAQRLGLSGFFGFDFMIEEATGDSFLIEMNPRCTPLSHLQLGDGRDLIAALSAQLSNTPLRAEPPVTDRDTIAYFPQAWHWNSESQFLKSSFHDVPVEEPELVRDLLRLPWPDRSALARLANRLRRTTFQHRASRGGVFESAPAGGKLQEAAAPQSKNSLELSAIVPLRASGTKPPLYVIPGVDGTMRPFQSLVRHLEPDQPVYGILSQALLGEPIVLTTVEELAAYYIKAIQALRPKGPYNFLGFSFGGLVAFEMARQLHDRGDPVGMLALLDNLRMGSRTNAEPPPPLQDAQPRQRSLAAYHFKQLLSAGGLSYAKDKLVARSLRKIYTALHARQKPIPRFLQRAIDINWFAAVNYVPRSYPGSIELFPSSDSTNDAGATNDLWAGLAGGGAALHSIPGGHEGVLQEPNVITLAKTLTRCLADANRASDKSAESLEEILVQVPRKPPTQAGQAGQAGQPGKSTASSKCHGTMAEDGCGPGDALQVK
jgi:thioesterase domain-containing protein